MKTLRASTFIRSQLLPFATVLWLGLSACTSWKEVKPPVEAALATERPSEVRVTLVDGKRFEPSSPVIRSDSLKWLKVAGSGAQPSVWGSVALSDVRSIEVRQSDAVETTLLVLGVGVLAVLGIAAVAAAVEDDSPPPRPSSNGEPVNFSCPLVYSWDGEGWRLDSGTFGGAFLEPLARTDVDGLEHARAENGLLRLRLANELQETDHVDELDLLVVDHAAGTEVVPDGSGILYEIGPLAAPLSARDDHGRDALAAIRDVDGWGWESSPTGRDTSVAADIRSSLVVEFERPSGSAEATLVIHGNNTPWASWLMQDFIAGHGRETESWYAAMNSDPVASGALGAALAREAFLSVSVWTGQTWEYRGLVWEAGPEIAKRQALPLDLASVAGETVRVRLESVPLYWNLDQVGIDFSASLAPEARIVEPDRATMENDERDVLAHLADQDGRELVLEPGDAAELSFQVPPVPAGQARSYLIATTGWYRIHTRNSQVPPRPELARVGTEPGAVSRLSVARLNEALAGLEARAALTTMSARSNLGGRYGQ